MSDLTPQTDLLLDVAEDLGQHEEWVEELNRVAEYIAEGDAYFQFFVQDEIEEVLDEGDLEGFAILLEDLMAQACPGCKSVLL